VLLVGTGGQLVEVFHDRALGLPPLNMTLARRMLERTRIYPALRGVRGRVGVYLAALDAALVQFSRLISEQPAISECDINPLLVSPQGVLALDARVVLHPASIDDSALPRPAIRPYPAHYAIAWRSFEGAEVMIRPIRPEDEPLLVAFHRTLSEESVYRRFFQLLSLEQRIAHDRLIHRCNIDYDREMALVAVTAGADGPTILGVGRLTKQHAVPQGEFALLVSDQAQGHGLGTELLRRLIAIAKDEKLQRLTADILPDNLAMQRLATDLGFRLVRSSGDLRATLDLA
jgi:acetyltransferase